MHPSSAGEKRTGNCDLLSEEFCCKQTMVEWQFGMDEGREQKQWIRLADARRELADVHVEGDPEDEDEQDDRQEERQNGARLPQATPERHRVDADPVTLATLDRLAAFEAAAAFETRRQLDMTALRPAAVEAGSPLRLLRLRHGIATRPLPRARCTSLANGVTARTKTVARPVTSSASEIAASSPAGVDGSRPTAM